MSKVSTQIKAMMRRPKSVMDFNLTGKLPTSVKPSSPLITLLESIPPRERIRITNIRLSPKLGYQSGASFNNAAQLLLWLKPSAWMCGTWPAESCRLKFFNNRLTRDDLIAHTK